MKTTRLEATRDCRAFTLIELLVAYVFNDGPKRKPTLVTVKPYDGP